MILLTVILMPYIRPLDLFNLHNCHFLPFDRDPVHALCTTYWSFFSFTLKGSIKEL